MLKTRAKVMPPGAVSAPRTGLQHWPARTRLLVGLALLVLVTLLPLPSPVALGLPGALTLAWLLLTLRSGRFLWRMLSFGTLLFAPLALVGWWLGSPWLALKIPMRGLCCMLISVATCHTIRLHEIEAALSFLPPAMARLLVHILLQSSFLLNEVRNIHNALRLRRANLCTLFAFPGVWLTRLILKAERVSDAMQMRGFE